MTGNSLLSWTPAAIVFDCDGTLMDSECHWVEARELVLRGYGVTTPSDFGERTKGLHFTECGRVMSEVAGLSADRADQVTEQLLDHFRKLVAADPVTIPGATEFVGLVSHFAPLAVASNCPRDVVESGLSHAGLLPRFVDILVPDGDLRPKPDPDLYLAATRACGAAPAVTLAVEDSYCGILSATRAGLRVLGVGPDPRDEELALVDLWVPTLADADLLHWATTRESLPESYVPAAGGAIRATAAAVAR
ncbi:MULTISPECIES: HAD family phosphatase [unclassified Embleya]|uniref:HAD family hydrolase n=1 Tax=unclassified Embleya TaxID=2699296 RepID=UPI0034059315